MTLGERIREARESAGLSREELRRKMLRIRPKAPSLSAIRDLENGATKQPQPRNLRIYETALGLG